MGHAYNRPIGSEPMASRLIGMEQNESSTFDLRRLRARWLIVGFLACAACLLGVEVVRSTPRATGQVTAAGEAGRMLAVAGQVTGDSYGLYLLDRENGIITLYQWLPNIRKLRLLAARNVTYDLQLDEYNTEPSPGEIQKLVRESRSLNSSDGR